MRLRREVFAEDVATQGQGSLVDPPTDSRIPTGACVSCVWMDEGGKGGCICVCDCVCGRQRESRDADSGFCLFLVVQLVHAPRVVQVEEDARALL